MDKTEKLSLARKKLKRFQSKNSHQSRNTNQLTHTTPQQEEVVANGDSASASSQDNQLEVHSQTISILVSEKSQLLSTLTKAQSDLESSQRTCALLSERLSNAVREVEEGVRERKALTETLAERNKVLEQSQAMIDQLNTSLTTTRASLDDKQQQVTELLSKLSAKSKEIDLLQSTTKDIRDQLVVQQLLVEQLQTSSAPSSPSPSLPVLQERASMAEEQVRTLSATVHTITSERDQAVSDAAALREAIMNNKQDTARQLGDVKTRLAEAEIRLQSLTDELANTRAERDSQLSVAAAKVAQLVQTHQTTLATVERERSNCQSRLHDMEQENVRLLASHKDQQQALAKLEDTLTAMRGEAVDQQNLLSTIAQDKATVSRAVAQNKELKNQLAELQEAFVQQTHRNMELATELETQQLKIHRLEQQAETTEPMSVTQEQEKRQHVDQTTAATQSEDVDTSSLHISRIQELTEECDSLRREKDQLLAELDRLHITPEEEEKEEEEDSMSPEQVSVLQQSFTSLQQRFVSLMAEKAVLHDQLQECEHVIVQLAGETETIAEYVTLYQTQREALKLRFEEKNKLIQRLCQDKSALESQLYEVQQLVRQLKPPPSVPAHLQHAPSNNDDPVIVDKLVTMIDQHIHHLHTQSPPALPCPCCSGQLLMV